MRKKNKKRVAKKKATRIDNREVGRGYHTTVRARFRGICTTFHEDEAKQGKTMGDGGGDKIKTKKD